MLLAFFRDASWLTARRLRDYASLLIASYGAAIIWSLTGVGLSDPNGKPLGTDFVSFWTVSHALHHGAASVIYHPEKLAALEQTLTGRPDLFYAWSYPPLALLIVYPLALLPYIWSLAAWLVVGLALYLQALWRILPRGLALWAGLAFPAVFLTLGHGQNALLSAGLIGTGLALLPVQPVAAGIAIGLLAFKPQLGILVPLALLAGGHWRALAAASITAATLAGLTVLFFGIPIWQDFLAGLPFTRAMLEQGLVPNFELQSVFAGARLLGASLAAAYGAQAIVAVAAAGLTVWIWRLPAEQGLKNAALVAATLIATPFVLDYDLTLLALAAAWLSAEQLRHGALPWERTALAAVCLAPLFARSFAQHTGIALTPLVEIALLLVLWRRCRVPRGALQARSAAAMV
jgi:Glycosyltransferase family 87